MHLAWDPGCQANNLTLCEAIAAHNSGVRRPRIGRGAALQLGDRSSGRWGIRAPKRLASASQPAAPVRPGVNLLGRPLCRTRATAASPPRFHACTHWETACLETCILTATSDCLKPLSKSRMALSRRAS